jgi:hypothetical protein
MNLIELIVKDEANKQRHWQIGENVEIEGRALAGKSDQDPRRHG